MVDRATKLRWRRKFRRSQKQVEQLGVQAEYGLEEHFFKRLNRLVGVRRFIVGWLFLFILLIAGVVVQSRALTRYYQTIKPALGGNFTEGIVGSFTDANPLYATGSVDAAVSKLVFSGLMKYDSNNQLVGDLAQSIQTDSRANVYTVVLRPDLKWHDGKPLTADDVVFTYKTIQNPDAKSPLIANWQKVKIEAKDSRTVVFTLPHGLTAFPHSLTNGIVPRHLLDSIPATQLRSIAFNTAKPIGSGPFKWDTVEVQGNTADTREERIGLVPNPDYHLGQPKLDHYTIRAFHDERHIADSFKNHELSAIAGLSSVPDNVKRGSSTVDYNIPLTGEVMVFFRNSQDILQDSNVRRAITKATNTNEVISGLGYPVIPANSPFLKSHVGYNKNIVQQATNVEEAKQILEANGWKVGKDGIRTKNGKPLTIRLYSQSDGQYAFVSQILQRQWRVVGVDAQVVLQQEGDLQTTIAFHNYDALLFGIALGPDPDVFAYWHSSQADPRSDNRLNLSEYKSATSDAALEAGRTRTDNNLRTIKYKPFLETWRNDAPGIALYQPRFLYISDGKIYNFNEKVMNAPVDRYADVQKWMIREDRQND